MRNFRLVVKIGIGVVVALALLSSLQIYAKRGIQGRMKSAADDIGEQYSRGSDLQYEPYYLDQSYSLDKSNATRSNIAKGTINSPAMPAIPRKLIRNAEMNLKVADAQTALQKIISLVNSLNGVTIDSYVNQRADEQKNGRAVFKVPPQNLDTALAQLRGFGKVEYEKITGEDVTEQYVDLQARLQNSQRVRDRLLKILDERAREVKDILEVERELARVGGEIESLEGRLKYLDRQVDLATISVTFYEKRIAILSGLNLGDEFRQTIKQSLQVFVHTFNGAIVVISGLLPIAFWILVVGGIITGIRKLFMKK